MFRSLAIVLSLTALGAAAAETLHYPSPNQPWTEREYVLVYFAHSNGNRALPHLREEASAAIFNRLVDPTNLTAIRAAHASAAGQDLSLDQMLATLGALRAAYYYAVRVGEPLSEELTRIEMFQLEGIATILSDPTGADLSATHPAWRTTMLSIADSLMEGDLYTDGQAIRLSDAMARHFTGLAMLLERGDQESLGRRLLARAKEARSDDLRATLARLALVVSN